ncbi:ATP-dependent helicase [Miniimonas arenae]|uniref:DNA 3'-5' helicase n=1 Tax=Miniimonas arenae TaxID=676201 RepID=A0A5C5BCJ4_9MICO|nr:ATP-dependent DNA helicase [Miniimonas arenae]TNU76009.1 ATP-dependent helicase [Miniimonas arenae]
MNRRWSAVALADLLGRPRPTPEQVRVIEADPEPMLVVAGAGSGKTSTMTDRVVWLVANEVVAPSEVLGLTFTRKAASELATRVERQLRALARVTRARDDAGEAPTDWLTERPRIATYNSYAAGLVTDHGLRLGLEADQVLLTEAGRFQVAARLVEQWPGDLEMRFQPVTVARSVVTLAGELAEHLLTPEGAAARLRAIADGLEDALPGVDGNGRSRTTPHAEVEKVVVSLRDRAALMPLVAAFAAAKRERGAMDFPDQVAAAARLARTFPAVAERERATARVVLLDEYQDTSVAQLEMLRALFGDGHPVTAVGDPHQGIYGWRGASAGALLSFPEHFPRHDGEPASVASLTTSWRNDVAVLAAANVTAAPLRAHASLAVPALEARPDAGPGEVRWTFEVDEQAQARAVARAIGDRWAPGRGTAAVLCRKRDWFEAVRVALTDAGLPCQVVGLAGLLHTPAVADVRAALTAAFDPSRGDALVRLLTGPAFRLGAYDLMALGDLARARTSRRAGEGQRREDSDGRSIVEALDLLPAEGWPLADGRVPSDVGRRRLARAQLLLREVRSLTHLGLPELVIAVEQALGLDLEVAAHGGGVERGRADLDQFEIAAAEFEAGSTAPTLGAFLAYLDAAEEYERGLDAASTEPDPGCVQILTAHAAKGLEWDIVAVVGLAEEDFPGLGGKPEAPTSPAWTTARDALPYELRGDADHLPDLEIGAGATHVDVRDALLALRAADGERALREERRLAYVAFTRARHSLLLSGAWWGSRKSPNTPSRFLTELVRAGVAQPLAGTAADALDRAPEQTEPTPPPQAPWPPTQEPRLEAALAHARSLVPGGSREPAPSGDVPRAGGLAVEHLDAADDADVAEWRWQVQALLAEREAALAPEPLRAPPHLSASAVVALASDAEGYVRDLRRPVPAQPSPYARRGTRFHTWVEQHYARAALLDVDDLGDEPTVDDDELSALQQAFLSSPWADRVPLAIEADVETPVAGTALRCRIDAVFPPAPGEPFDVHIVDWKTGAPARGSEARRARELQLAAYRLGWSRLHDVPIERVAASFHFVGSGETHDAPVLAEEEVVALLEAELGALTGSGPGGG